MAERIERNRMKRRGQIRIGISGWRYKGWRGTFYPAKLAQRLELEYAASHFNSIELNGSFYSLQRPASFAQWREATPGDFVFAVKGSRFITHMLRLRGVEGALGNFLAQGVLGLGEKLGPILWQFPAKMNFDAERFGAFFALLPRTQEEAAAFAKSHNNRPKNKTWFAVEQDRPLRHAVEIRNSSFVCEEFIALLRRHRVALVVADTVEWPLLMDVTADFVYCRLHGSEQLYASGYDKKAIDTWAHRVMRWAGGDEVRDGERASAKDARRRSKRDVFVYFDNDAKVRAPVDAQSLRERIEQLSGPEVKRASRAAEP
jgi:uncharacterized protein YecE (DUF72 family)